MKDLVYHDEGRGAFAPLKKMYGKIGAPEMMGVACKIPIKGTNVLDVIYDATALEFWVSYAKGETEAYKRPFVHVKLRDTCADRFSSVVGRVAGLTPAPGFSAGRAPAGLWPLSRGE